MSRKCTQADITHLLPHVPPDFHRYLKVEDSLVELSQSPGLGPYQGYDGVWQFCYRFNQSKRDLNTKVFPTLVSRYSQQMRGLSQISVVVHYA